MEECKRVNLREQLDVLNRQYKEEQYIYHQLAAKCGMSDSNFWVLYTVYSNAAPMSQNDLCEEWFYPKQTVNTAIGTLTRSGYVELCPIPGTRNKKEIRLTEAGEKLCREGIQPVIDAECAALGAMSEADRVAMIRLLGEFRGLLKEKFEQIPERGEKRK